MSYHGPFPCSNCGDPGGHPLGCPVTSNRVVEWQTVTSNRVDVFEWDPLAANYSLAADNDRLRYSLFTLQWPLVVYAAIVGRE